MKINAQKNGFLDLTEDHEILSFVEKIDANATSFEINLYGCLIGYETSILIENIASKISNSQIKKHIHLEIEYPFLSEQTLWEWFFKNSSLWKEYNISDNNDNAKKIIQEALLSKFNIDFSIGSK